MFISKKNLQKLIKEVYSLKTRVENLEKSKTTDPVAEISYKEVVDEWLNGKKI
ncbi:MAG: hypothetical protein J6A90_04915 [Clostridia bacterium]|nr:hypothetical protein [Clostridia bacterium]